jgi:hypothetical protein
MFRRVHNFKYLSHSTHNVHQTRNITVPYSTVNTYGIPVIIQGGRLIAAAERNQTKRYRALNDFSPDTHSCSSSFLLSEHEISKNCLYLSHIPRTPLQPPHELAVHSRPSAVSYVSFRHSFCGPWTSSVVLIPACRMNVEYYAIIL